MRVCIRWDFVSLVRVGVKVWVKRHKMIIGQEIFGCPFDLKKSNRYVVLNGPVGPWKNPLEGNVNISPLFVLSITLWGFSYSQMIWTLDFVWRTGFLNLAKGLRAIRCGLKEPLIFIVGSPNNRKKPGVKGMVIVKPEPFMIN